MEKKFERGGVYRTLFINRYKDELLVAHIYVDDIVFRATSSDLTLSFAKEMKTKFEMSMVGELTFFLGLKIRQLKDGIFFSQSKYVRELVNKFGLESTKHPRTPMSTTTELSKDAFGKYVEQKLYRSIIRGLLYLTVSHLDISFSVGACTRYQANPKESHLTIIKRIIRYINETFDYGLLYPYDSSLMVVGYSNVDWVENVEDRKITSGACFFIGDCLVACLSKKQNFISLSIIEVEYIAIGNC